MLETIRQYARERADPERLQEAQRRHVEWLLDLAARDEDQVAWLDRLEAERDNLRAALDFVQAEPERLAAGLRLADRLCTFFAVRGGVEEGRQRYAALLEKLAPGDPERPHILYCAARMARSRGDHAEARRLFEACLLHKDDPELVAQALSHLGFLSFNADDLPAARRQFERSLAIWRALGNEEQVAGKLTHTGIVAWRQGDLARARRRIEAGIAVHRRRNNRLALAAILHYLGFVARDEGRFDEERACYEEALTLNQETGDRKGAAEMHVLLGDWARGRGNHAAARRHYEQAQTLFRQAGEPREAERILRKDLPCGARN